MPPRKRSEQRCYQRSAVASRICFTKAAASGGSFAMADLLCCLELDVFPFCCQVSIALSSFSQVCRSVASWA